MKVYHEKIYNFFKELIISIRNSQNIMDSKLPKDDLSDFSDYDKFQLTAEYSQLVVDYFEKKLIKPGIYFNSLKILENIMLSSGLFSHEEVYDFLECLIKSDINTCQFVGNEMPLTRNLIFHYYFLEVNPVEIKKLLDSSNRIKWIELIKKCYPDKSFKICTSIIKQDTLVKELKKVYETLNDCYFNTSFVKEEEKEQVISSLKKLSVSDEFISFLLNKKKPRVKISVKKAEKHIDFKLTPNIFKSYKIPSLTLAEINILKEKVNLYYDIRKKQVKRSLDILEQIELVSLLIQLEYSKEEIEKILFDVDNCFLQKDFVNDKSDYFRNVKARLLLMKNALKLDYESPKLLDDIKEMEECTDKKEKADIRELIIKTLKVETNEYIYEISKIKEEVNHEIYPIKVAFRNSYIKQLQSIYGNTYSLIQIIRKQYKNSSNGTEKLEWRLCIDNLFKRLAAEQFVDKTFVMKEGSRVAKKEEEKRRKKMLIKDGSSEE